MRKQKASQKNFKISIATGTSSILFVTLLAFTIVEQNIVNYVKETEIPALAGTVAGTTSLNAEVHARTTNTLYQELKEREQELREREKAQDAKENYFNARFEPTPGTIKFLYLLVGTLFILILINFTFDIRRHLRQEV